MLRNITIILVMGLGSSLQLKADTEEAAQVKALIKCTCEAKDAEKEVVDFNREARREKAGRRLMRMFDADRDGKLSSEELGAARKGVEAAFAHHEKKMMNRFDADKDGAINAQEKQMAMKAQNPEIQCVCVAEEIERPSELKKSPVDEALETSTEEKSSTDTSKMQ